MDTESRIFKRKNLFENITSWKPPMPAPDKNNENKSESRTVILMSEFDDGIMISADSMTSFGSRQLSLNSQKVSFLNPLVMSAGTGYVNPLFEIEAIAQRASRKEMAFRQLSYGLDSINSIPKAEEIASYMSLLFRRVSGIIPFDFGAILVGGLSNNGNTALFQVESPGLIYPFTSFYQRHTNNNKKSPLLFSVDGCGIYETNPSFIEMALDRESFFRYKTREDFTLEKSLISHIISVSNSFKENDGRTQGVGGNVYVAYLQKNGDYMPHFDVFDYKKIRSKSKELKNLETLITNGEDIGNVSNFISSLKAEYNGKPLSFDGDKDYFSPGFNAFGNVQAIKPKTHKLNRIQEISIPGKLHTPKKILTSTSFASSPYGNLMGKVLRALKQGETPFEESAMLAYRIYSTPDPVEENSIHKELPALAILRLDPAHLSGYEHVSILDFDYGEKAFASFYGAGSYPALSRNTELLMQQIFIEEAFLDILDNFPQRADVQQALPVLSDKVKYFLGFDNMLLGMNNASSYIGFFGQILNNGKSEFWESNPLDFSFRKLDDCIAITSDQMKSAQLENIVRTEIVLDEDSNKDDVALVKGLAYFSKTHYQNSRSYNKIREDLMSRLSIRVPAFNRASYNSVILPEKKEWLIDQAIEYMKK